MGEKNGCCVAAADLIENVDHVHERFLPRIPERQEMLRGTGFRGEILKVTTNESNDEMPAIGMRVLLDAEKVVGQHAPIVAERVRWIESLTQFLTHDG